MVSRVRQQRRSKRRVPTSSTVPDNYCTSKYEKAKPRQHEILYSRIHGHTRSADFQSVSVSHRPLVPTGALLLILEQEFWVLFLQLWLLHLFVDRRLENISINTDFVLYLSVNNKKKWNDKWILWLLLCRFCGIRLKWIYFNRCEEVKQWTWNTESVCKTPISEQNKVNSFQKYCVQRCIFVKTSGSRLNKSIFNDRGAGCTHNRQECLRYVVLVVSQWAQHQYDCLQCLLENNSILVNTIGVAALQPSTLVNDAALWNLVYVYAHSFVCRYLDGIGDPTES